MKNKLARIEESYYGKIPPQAIEIEEALLGALMLESDTISEILDIIDVHSFYKDEHQKIYNTVKTIYQSKKPIDLLTVTQELKEKDLLDEVGGAVYITQLTGKVASAANIEYYAKIIAEKYYLRESIRRATEIIQMAYADEDVETIGNEWRNSWESLESIFSVSDVGTHIKEVLRDTLDEIEKDSIKVIENQTPGIPTGFVGLDTNTGGWRGGNLNILAARPGVGKTSLALQFMLEAAKKGYWVNFFSYEMNKEDLARIIIAGESGIYRSDIRDGYIKNEDWEKINSVISYLETLPIIFKDSSGMNVNQVRSMIRKNRKNERCDFVIVDYLQLIKPVNKQSVRELEIAEISRTLKGIVLTENIPILALSQLNREADSQMPKLSNLRESGTLEQDADIVFFLVPNKDTDEMNFKEDTIRFVTAKHRRGALGDMDIYHNRDMTKFSENMTSGDNQYWYKEI